MSAYTPAEAAARETFLALMWALSYPGRPQQLPESSAMTGALARIGDTLLDLETSFYTPDTELARILERTGARHLSPADAAYHFYPTLTGPTDLSAASIGSMLYPDTAATIFIGCTFDSPTPLRLTGPGIDGTITIAPAGVPADLWTLRASRVRYPLGWELLLTDGTQIIGLPRSTRIEQGD
jgi:alpha-D-ribose 1-methylphosphonate 5-triphosphate synthase subunit PhnH